jgi:hypothetical protein
LPKLKSLTMKKIIISAFVLFTAFRAFAQDNGVDSKNKNVFSYYAKSDDVNIQVSTALPLAVSRVFQIRKMPYYIDSAGVHKPTVNKFLGYSLAIAMLNSGSDDYLDFKKLRPGLQLKAGIQCYLDTVFYRLDTRYGCNSWGFNFVYKMDNIDLYDTDQNVEVTRHPSSYGIEAYFNWFRPVRLNAKTHQVLALTASYNSTWNDDELLNYQNISEATVGSKVVAFQDFRGRYGSLKTGIGNFRASVAYPVYAGNFNPIPFFAYNNYSNDVSDYHLGLFLNLLAKPVEATNFKIPSAFGLGVDWIHSGSRFSSANFILKGTLAL